MWQTEQDLKCPGCGQPRDEVWVFGPDDQREKRERWQASLRKCVACAHVETEDHRSRQNIRDDLRRGTHLTVERVDGGS